MSALPSSESGSKFRVAICGAGIAGLVLAITIGKYDPSIPIDLYEAHDCIDTDGVGITVWQQVNEVMIELGLFDDLKRIFTPNDGDDRGPCIRRADIHQGGYVWYQRGSSGRPSAMHRQHLVAVLEKHLPASCTVHPKKRLVRYIEREQQDAHPTPSIRLEFADGTAATADVLVGADGIRSAVRESMFDTAASEDDGDKSHFRQYIDATFTGMISYRFVISADALRKEHPENLSLKELNAYCGKGRYLIAYPIAKGTLINVATVISDPSWKGTRYEGRWVGDASRDDVVNPFHDFEPDVRALVKLCEQPTKWALHVVEPLPFSVRKRVALVGDACHATTPHYGAGSGQAIDDAFVLGRLLSHPLTTRARIPDVLRIYEAVRLPFAQTVARYSLSTGWMYLFMEPGYYDGTRQDEDLDERGVSAYEREGMETTKQEILRRWAWMDDSTSALHAWAEAEKKLQALVGQVAY